MPVLETYGIQPVSVSEDEIKSHSMALLNKTYMKVMHYVLAKLKTGKCDFSNMLIPSYYNVTTWKKIKDKYNNDPIKYILDEIQSSYDFAKTMHSGDEYSGFWFFIESAQFNTYYEPHINQTIIDDYYNIMAEHPTMYWGNDYMLYWRIDNTIVEYWKWPYTSISNNLLKYVDVLYGEEQYYAPDKLAIALEYDPEINTFNYSIRPLTDGSVGPTTIEEIEYIPEQNIIISSSPPINRNPNVIYLTPEEADKLIDIIDDNVVIINDELTNVITKQKNPFKNLFTDFFNDMMKLLKNLFNWS